MQINRSIGIGQNRAVDSKNQAPLLREDLLSKDGASASSHAHQKPKRGVVKRPFQAVAPAVISALQQSCHFFIFDNTNSLHFLVDTGEEISVNPPKS